MHWWTEVFHYVLTWREVRRMVSKCNNVCFNYVGIRGLELCWVPECTPEAAVTQPATTCVAAGLVLKFVWLIKSNKHRDLLMCVAYFQQTIFNLSPHPHTHPFSPSRPPCPSDLLNHPSFLVCSPQSSWPSMYPKAKPNKLIRQSPLYTLPPTKRLMVGAV